MKPRFPILPIILGLFLLATVALTIWRQRRSLEKVVAATRSEHRRLSARAWLAQNAQKQTQSPAPLGEKTPAERRIPSDSPVAEALQRDPALQKLFLGSENFKIQTRYGRFFRQAVLTPEQRDQIGQQMLKQSQDELDIKAAGRELGLAPDDPSLVRLRQAADDELHAAEATILNPTQLQQLTQYERSLPAQTAVNSVAAQAAVSELSLTSKQIDQLTQGLANASADYQKGSEANLDTVDWPNAMAGARNVLSDAQFRLVQSIMAEREAEGNLDEYIKSAMKPAK